MCSSVWCRFAVVMAVVPVVGGCVFGAFVVWVVGACGLAVGFGVFCVGFAFCCFPLGVCYAGLVAFGGGKLQGWWFSSLICAGWDCYPVCFCFRGVGGVTLVMSALVWWVFVVR